MIAMPRTRAFVLVLLISLGVLSYMSFDAYIRPAVVGISWPDSKGTVVTRPNNTSQTPANPRPITHPSPNILLVSAFFPLSKSKHSMSDYSSWLSRFLKPIKTPIYFFTTPDMEPLIRQLRGDLPITINTSYVSPFDIPPLSGDMKQKYEEMWNWDREKHRHSPELYAVWSGKPFFLDEGLRNAEALLPPTYPHPHYKYAFWSDAGSFRDSHDYSTWPDPARVEEVWDEGSKKSGTKADDLLFFPMWAPPHTSMQFWGAGMGPIDNEFSEGSFFGGTPSTISWWRNEFFRYHDHYLSQGIFVGKDQTLINALFLLNPKRIISVWLLDPNPPAITASSSQTSFGDISAEHKEKRGLFGSGNETPLGACGKTWYYYQFFLASSEEREKMKARWGSAWEFKPWSWDWWTGKSSVDKGDGRCRLTRVVAMEVLLKSVFGKGWRAPGS